MPELIKLFGLKFFLKQPSVLQIFLSVLHNCISNCCIASTYKLMTEICIHNIHTILCPERIGIFFTVRVPNLKRECLLCKLSCHILTKPPQNAAKSGFHKHLPHTGCLYSVNVSDSAKYSAMEKEAS